MELLGPFLRLRRAVAAEAVAVARERATPDEVAELEALAAELATAQGAALAEGNLRFARRVVELADNLPMLLLFNTVASTLRARPDILEATLADVAGVRASFAAVAQLIDAHRALPPGVDARTLVRAALEAVDAAALARIEATPPSEEA